jgi:site-specific DNA recombinase
MSDYVNSDEETASFEKPRAAIYLRVSTMSQVDTDFTDDGYSLAAQREDCLRIAGNLEADVAEVYVERGESARTSNRPQLQRLLRRLKEDRDIDYVIVHKLDRLSRSVEDGVLIRLAISKAGAQLVSATEKIDDTPHGRLVTNILSDVVSFYSDNLAAEALKGMRQKAKLGGTNGLAPIGYLNVIKLFDGREVRTIEVDSERAPEVQWAFEHFAEGDMTLDVLAEALGTRGLRTRGTKRTPSKALTRSGVHNMLKNPYYIGVVTFKGVQYDGRHDPLISSELYWRVQDILAGRRKWGERPQRRTHYLKGSLACGLCKQQLSIGYSRGKGGGVYPYFFCLGRHRDQSCGLPYLSFDCIEEMVEDFWREVVIEPDELEAIRSDVTSHLHQVTKAHDGERKRQLKRLERLDGEGKKLLQALYADAIDLPTLREEQARISRERTDAQIVLEAVTSDAKLLFEALNEALMMLGEASGLYLGGSEAIRRELNHGLFKRLFVVPDGIGGADLATPYAHLLTDDLGERLTIEATTAAVGASEAIVHGGVDPIQPFGPPQARRFERPRGLLPAETENPALFSEPGSNMTLLVGLAGFEPATS